MGIVLEDIIPIDTTVHVKKRAKAKRALKRLRTIAGIFRRELRRELPQYCLFECYQRDFLLYKRVLRQQQNDTNKIYSLHEPQMYCVVEGKDPSIDS